MDFPPVDDGYCQSQLCTLFASDSESEQEIESPGMTTVDDSSDSAPSCMWPEDEYPKVVSPYFKEGYEKKGAKKYMIRLYWTREGKELVRSVHHGLDLMLGLETGTRRTTRRFIAGVNWGSGEALTRNRHRAFTYYRNLATFLDNFLKRPATEIMAHLDRYEDLIEEVWQSALLPNSKPSPTFDVLIRIFELETVPLPEVDVDAHLTTEDGSIVAEGVPDFGVPNFTLTTEELEEMLGAFDDGVEQPPRQRRRLSDLAYYEAIKKCLVKKKRPWCAKGRVIGLYEDGLGDLKPDDVPLAYKVCSTDPCMVEDPLHGVPLHEQVQLVLVRIDSYSILLW